MHLFHTEPHTLAELLAHMVGANGTARVYVNLTASEVQVTGMDPAVMVTFLRDPTIGWKWLAFHLGDAWNSGEVTSSIDLPEVIALTGWGPLAPRLR